MIKLFLTAALLLSPVLAFAQSPVTQEQANQILLMQGAVDYIQTARKQADEIVDLHKQIDDLKKQVPAKPDEKK